MERGAQGLLDEPRPGAPRTITGERVEEARAGHPRLQRNGTGSLFAALDAATGKVIGQLRHRHRAVEFKEFLAAIDTHCPLPAFSP